MSKNKVFKQLFNYIPSVIILFIAGCAFFASFIQSDYSAQVNALQEEFTEKQTELERLVVKQQAILSEDTAYVLTGNDWIAAALDIAYEWKEKRSSGAPSFPFENASMLSRIASYLDFRLWLFRGSNIGTIQAYFGNNPTATEYVLADQATNGFDFVIPRISWEAEGYGDPVNLNSFLIQYNFPGISIPFIVAKFQSQYPTTATIQVGMQINRFNEYLQSFVIDQQSELNDLNTEIEALESLISQISNGVALITVATILSAAMAERISSADASTEMSTIRADILKDDTVIEKRSNKLSILILIGASLLSVGGLVASNFAYPLKVLTMSLAKQFSLNKKLIGKSRWNWAEKNDKDIGKMLEYQACVVPTLPEDKEERAKFIADRNDEIIPFEEEKRVASFFFSAKPIPSKETSHLTNLLGYACPLKLGTRRGMRKYYVLEYTYSTIIPAKIDEIILFAVKRGFRTPSREFYSYPFPEDFERISITEEDLFRDAEVGFKLAEYLHMIRLTLSTRKSTWGKIKTQKSPTAIVLGKHKKLKGEASRFQALSNSPGLGPGVIQEDLGISVIAIPSGEQTIIQVGSFRNDPKRALKVLNYLAESFQS